MRATALQIVATAVLLTGGCESSSLGSGEDGGPGGTDSGRTDDGGPGTMDSGGGGGDDAGRTGADTGPPIATGTERGEICGNDYDDDGNGIVDDGCDCAVGTERPCWLGPEDARGMGICHDGVQSCESEGATATWSYCNEMQLPEREILHNGFDDDCDGTVDEPDGICSATANDETGAACGNARDDDCDTLTDCDDPSCAGESSCPGGCEDFELCWGGADEDCDGDVDCDDADCADDPSCDTGICPAGQTPTYRERDLGSSWGPSSISEGPGGPRMPMTCEDSDCADGQVQVVRVGESPICVPPPPDCDGDTHPNYVASGMWRCDGPCELIIHYGALFGGKNKCADRPDESCPSGQVPTFIYETETWQCRETCRNAEYDQITLDGSTVCVPC